MTSSSQATSLKVSLSADGRMLGGEDADRLPLLLKADAVDSLLVTLLPVVIGGSKIPAISGFPEGFLPSDIEFRLKEISQQKGCLNLLYVRKRRTSKNSHKQRNSR